MNSRRFMYLVPTCQEHANAAQIIPHHILVIWGVERSGAIGLPYFWVLLLVPRERRYSGQVGTHTSCQLLTHALQQTTCIGCNDSIDHLVGQRQQIVGECDPERLRGPPVDHELEFGGLQHRQVGGLGALENPAGATQKTRHAMLSETRPGALVIATWLSVPARVVCRMSQEPLSRLCETDFRDSSEGSHVVP
jgi:hypothetical protein